MLFHGGIGSALCDAERDVNPYAAGTAYIRFQAIFRPLNSTRIAKMLCDRCLVNLIVTF